MQCIISEVAATQINPIDPPVKSDETSYIHFLSHVPCRQHPACHGPTSTAHILSSSHWVCLQQHRRFSTSVKSASQSTNQISVFTFAVFTSHKFFMVSLILPFVRFDITKQLCGTHPFEAHAVCSCVDIWGLVAGIEPLVGGKTRFFVSCGKSASARPAVQLSLQSWPWLPASSLPCPSCSLLWPFLGLPEF